MMRMQTENQTDPILFDCVWILKPPNSYLHLKTHIMMKVESFENMAGVSEMIIRQGLSSHDAQIIF